MQPTITDSVGTCSDSTLDAFQRYRGRPITDLYRKGSRHIVFKVEGLPAITHTLPSSADQQRRAKLRALLGGRSSVGLRNPYPDLLWTMRDLTWALKLPYSRRGQIGKDLKMLGVYKRKKVRRLTRRGKEIPACGVFSVFPFRGVINGKAFKRTPASIREQYRSEAKERLRVCQQIRARG